MNDKAEVKDTSRRDFKKILWTGGWDSSFRILDLVLNKREIVQPHYILDDERKSAPLELAAMKKIRQMVMEMDSLAGERILDTITMKTNEIPRNREITSNFKKLASTFSLGNQYDWLARYAESLEANDLELCINKDDNIEEFIRDDVRSIELNGESYYELVEAPSLAELNIFSRYHFPLLKMTKIDMEEKARQSGFLHIMEETWFCHSPTKNGKPCGVCNPCKYTKEEGLARRVPIPAIATLAKISVKRMKKRVRKLLSSQ